jgi:hypothetical protein
VGAATARRICDFARLFGIGAARDPGALRGLTNVGYDTGTANAAVVTFTLAGMRFWIKKYTSANTGAMTLNGVALNWADGSALVAGDWPASVFAEVIYNGATYGLLSVMGPSVFSRKSATIVPFTSSKRGVDCPEAKAERPPRRYGRPFLCRLTAIGLVA